MEYWSVGKRYRPNQFNHYSSSPILQHSRLNQQKAKCKVILFFYNLPSTSREIIIFSISLVPS